MTQSTTEVVDWGKQAAKIRWNIQPFIDGRYRPGGSHEVLENINPATERPLFQFNDGSAADVNAAVQAARHRLESGCWSGIPATRRADALMKLAELINVHAHELALMDVLQMGKPIRQALQDAQITGPRLLRSWAGFADKLTGESAPLVGEVLYLNTYVPRGVVGAITAWNFPVVNAVYKIGPALAAGNCVVLKPSELAPASALRIAELAVQAGVPEGVLNVVPGRGRSTGMALAQHMEVDMISFTGSTATGRRIMELAGRSNGKPLLLECGGKSPHVVFDDAADLDAVADAVVSGFVWNQGQVCSAHTRLIVHESISEELSSRVVSRAARYIPADPLLENTEFGPLASPAQRERVRSFIQEGERAGARVVLKGTIQSSDGCFVAPTVLDRVGSTMSILRDEIFGPVLCVQSFQTETEAVSLANATDFGLAATVWTRDLGRAKRLVRAIKAGAVMVRTSGAEKPGPGFILSHEPTGASGFGSELGLRGLQAYSTLKSAVFSGA